MLNNAPATNPAMPSVTSLRLTWFLTLEVKYQSSILAKMLGRRLDARTALFGPGVSVNIFLHCEVQELSGTSRITRRMAQDESAATKQPSRLAMFCQNQGLHQAVRERQRRARDAVTQAVPESLSVELRASQLNNESTMEMRVTGNSFPNWKRSSISAEALKRAFGDRAQSTRSGRRCTKKLLFGTNAQLKSRSRRSKTLPRYV